MSDRPPELIKPSQGKNLTGLVDGHGWRILTDRHSSKMVMGLIYVDPGKSPHRWHNHDSQDSKDGYTVHYPEGFEEAYVVVQGRGLLQWKENGEIKEQRFETGDCIYCPPGVVEHQLLNDQEVPMTVVYAGTPPMV